MNLKVLKSCYLGGPSEIVVPLCRVDHQANGDGTGVCGLRVITNEYAATFVVAGPHFQASCPVQEQLSTGSMLGSFLPLFVDSFNNRRHGPLLDSTRRRQPFRLTRLPPSHMGCPLPGCVEVSTRRSAEEGGLGQQGPWVSIVCLNRRGSDLAFGAVCRLLAPSGYRMCGRRTASGGGHCSRPWDC